MAQKHQQGPLEQVAGGLPCAAMSELLDTSCCPVQDMQRPKCIGAAPNFCFFFEASLSVTCCRDLFPFESKGLTSLYFSHARWTWKKDLNVEHM